MNHGAPPPDAVYVGRPSQWGNPFVIGRNGTRERVIAMYKDYILARPKLLIDAKAQLKGKDLVCWCAPNGGIEITAEPVICHAQILGKIANDL